MNKEKKAQETESIEQKISQSDCPNCEGWGLIVLSNRPKPESNHLINPCNITKDKDAYCPDCKTRFGVNELDL